ncbi:bifunctional UDP-N-acetylglucosamine diphosphorylase/glucosamine-1-phosphate N-acetyltransferase GlmU [Ketobacter nezhaii]|uniref:bifunctional UDP-N-acetylglucosamine diphosphorylase/glucosamine-1-phosphate N-acetyltransferase GlmU n=1 Tax=Ketobacter sp. MCCC 1A13808 TaxID=2602738 RepID=UPI00294FF14A|nr:bifunctional UDP-N-acetylglucosamine diphosphorylase/glucosamine-1-phosphate N-acetyltransferase GlmU [Ketobacter sp. MCCC 1A13808]
MMDLNVVILAAGKGTRMKSKLPKVLQPLAKQSLLAHVLKTSLSLNAAKVIVVYGHGGEQVKSDIGTGFSAAEVEWVEQSEQLGTGHAVLQALPHLNEGSRTLILYGDVPLISENTLTRFLNEVSPGDTGVLTVKLPDPTGYGRIVRDHAGVVREIVEEKDAGNEIRKIVEVNTGIMLADSKDLQQWLPSIDSNNAQGEYYLTDLVKIANQHDVPVIGCRVKDPIEVEGVNDKRQLARLERLYQRKLAEELMIAGATLADPARIDIRGQVNISQDCFIDVNVVFEGQVELGTGVQIGPNCVIIDSVIGAGSIIKANCVLENAQVGEGCDVGPFARLRPGTEMKRGARIGNFVETKNTIMEEGAKASHLTYLGDSEIGRDVNIGAGTITCNYDGVNKHKTIIGEGAFIGSNSALVAPVDIGAGATIGAGSTITKSAKENALTLTRAKQLTIESWKRPEKNSQ